MKNIFFIFLILLLASCGNNVAVPELDTPVRGKIVFSIDENVQPIADELIDAFETSYPEAFLIQHYNNQKNVLKELYDDSSRLALMTRRLKPDERAYFEKQNFFIEEIKIGAEAVVFLVNRENPDSSFTTEEIRRILLSEDSLWTQINPSSALGKIQVVFDNPASSNISYLSDTLLGGKGTGKNCFALTNSDSVIAYVQNNPGAIGVLGLNWLGDKDSKEDLERRSRISLALIGKDTGSFTHPHQSALVTGDYPFTRGIWIVKIGKRAGLGTGFASFALGDRGQLIVQHAGLAPASPAERRIQLTTY
jgi:phosphate transport system substrate-binding protein